MKISRKNTLKFVIGIIIIWFIWRFVIVSYIFQFVRVSNNLNSKIMNGEVHGVIKILYQINSGDVIVFKNEKIAMQIREVKGISGDILILYAKPYGRESNSEITEKINIKQVTGKIIF